MGSTASVRQVHDKEINICGVNIQFLDKIKNLGVYFDKNFTMSTQVNHMIRSMYLELRNIAKVRDLIDAQTAARLVVSFVLPRLDYCNSLLAGISAENVQKLQVVQNNAARLILKKRKFDSATPMLRSLHWLPVERRLQYKIALICQKCMYGTAPSYLQGMVKAYTPARQLRSSFDTCILVVPRMRLKTVGEKSFSFLAPKVWNSLPQTIRTLNCESTFKSKLKTYLFSV